MDIAKYFTTENAAFAVALASMLGTVVQAWVTRKHNKLSVRPIITAHNHWIRDASSIEVVITLQNRGIGPGTIEQLFLEADGKKIEAPAGTDNVVEHHFKQAFGEILPMAVQETCWPEGRTLRANEDCVVARVWFGAGYDQKTITALAEGRLGSDLRLNGTYTCMYGGKWPIAKKIAKSKKPTHPEGQAGEGSASVQPIKETRF